MRMHKIIGGVAAAVLAVGIAAAPANADAGDRHKKRQHVGVSAVRDPNGGWDIKGSLSRRGAGVPGAALIIQSKQGGKWKKVRGSAIRTDATGLATYPAGICVHKVFSRTAARAYNPTLRIHAAGNRKYAEGNSRHFRAPCN